MSSSATRVDEIYRQIGEIGPYQILVVALLGVCVCVPVISGYSYSFYAATPDFRCKIPGYANDTFEIQSEYHAHLVAEYIPPPGPNSYRNTYDTCQIKAYRENKTSVSDETASDHVLVKCDEWVYSKKYFEETIITKWNLVCHRATTKSLFSTFYFIGTYGVLLSGIVSDKIGRKKTTYLFLIGSVIFNVLLEIVISFDFLPEESQQILFGILRLLTGVASNVYAVCTVLAIEICGQKKRVFASTGTYYVFILSEFIVVLFAYLIRDYKYLYLAYNAILVSILFIVWPVPESPRWLLTKGRHEEALKIFTRIAKSNKKPATTLIQLNKLSQERTSVKDFDEVTIAEVEPPAPSFIEFLKQLKSFVKSRKFLISGIVILINWLTNTLVYYGISFNTTELAGDPYLNFTLAVVVELIAIGASHFAYEKFGRKIPYAINMSLIGVALLLVMFVPKEYPYVITALTLVGKLSISFTYNGIYIITSEMYPTVIRNSTVSFCQAFARIGAVIAPLIQSLGELYWYPIPFIIFGGFSALSALTFVMFVPETKNKKLPDTMEEYLTSPS